MKITDSTRTLQEHISKCLPLLVKNTDPERKSWLDTDLQIKAEQGNQGCIDRCQIEVNNSRGALRFSFQTVVEEPGECWVPGHELHKALAECCSVDTILRLESSEIGSFLHIDRAQSCVLATKHIPYAYYPQHPKGPPSFIIGTRDLLNLARRARPFTQPQEGDRYQYVQIKADRSWVKMVAFDRSSVVTVRAPLDTGIVPATPMNIWMHHDALATLLKVSECSTPLPPECGVTQVDAYTEFRFGNDLSIWAPAPQEHPPDVEKYTMWGDPPDGVIVSRADIIKAVRKIKEESKDKKDGATRLEVNDTFLDIFDPKNAEPRARVPILSMPDDMQGKKAIFATKYLLRGLQSTKLAKVSLHFVTRQVALTLSGLRSVSDDRPLTIKEMRKDGAELFVARLMPRIY